MNGAYFVTICTQNRKKILSSIVGDGFSVPKPYGIIAEEMIAQIPVKYPSVAVDKYVIMPDHIHLILRLCTGADGRMVSAPTVSTVIGSMKRWVSRQAGSPLWQKSFYDHAIRNQQDYDEVWTYIENNPTKYFLEKAP